MDPQDYAQLKIAAFQSAQKAADGVTGYLENLRYDYLEGKEKMSISESSGYRTLTESGGGQTRRLEPAGTGFTQEPFKAPGT